MIHIYVFVCPILCFLSEYVPTHVDMSAAFIFHLKKEKQKYYYTIESTRILKIQFTSLTIPYVELNY